MFLVRADGNARIGAGHLVRCVSIAEELAQREGCGEVCFLCADSQSAEMAQSYGFRSYVLGTDYQNMESELPLWKELAAEPSVRQAAWEGNLFILVDSYYVTKEYLEALGQMGHVILMDDFGTERYPVDWVINYNAPASPEAYGELYSGQETVQLIGSTYVPLRRQFRTSGTAESRANSEAGGRTLSVVGVSEAGGRTSSGAGVSEACGRTLGGAGVSEACGRTPGGAGVSEACGRTPDRAGVCEVREEAKAVLITTGGGDSENIAGKILKKLYANGLEFHVVMGQFHPYFQEMKGLEKEYTNIHIHHNVTDMAALMRNCDIAVTAGGSTIYELAAVGVPFVCFSYAVNQELLTEYVGREGIGGYAGAWHREPGAVLERLEKQFWELVGDGKTQKEYIFRARAMTDGRGAERIADALLGKNSQSGC